jgi:chloramphenicol-sensitive protein RarD
MATHDARADERTGMLYALAAYGVWGVVPLFWHQLDAVPSTELLAHRVVWSTPLLALVAWRRGTLGEIGALLRDRRRLPWMLASAFLIGVNWMVYLAAVQANRVVEASLGYFVNPLVNVLLGLVVLRERLRPGQWGALAVAAAGVGVFMWRAGGAPWLALALAGSFGLYGLVRKQAPTGALTGSVVELGLLAGLGVAYLVGLAATGGGALGHASPGIHVLVLLGGLVTAAPALWFAEATRRLPLSGLAFVQYLSPLGQLLVGVLVYGEPFDAARAQGFALIWVALVLYTIEARWTVVRARAAVAK